VRQAQDKAMVLLLLELGAAPSIHTSNANGQSAMSLAADGGDRFKDVLPLLQSYDGGLGRV
jgi:hypothetical protein